MLLSNQVEKPFPPEYTFLFSDLGAVGVVPGFAIAFFGCNPERQEIS